MTEQIDLYVKDAKALGRIRSLRTEQTYRSVLLRHADLVGNRDMRTIGRDDIKRTLNEIGTRQDVSLNTRNTIWALTGLLTKIGRGRVDKHVLTAVVASNGAHETEPVVGENRGSEVVLTLDDGTELYLDCVELQALVNQRAPALRAA